MLLVAFVRAYLDSLSESSWLRTSRKFETWCWGCADGYPEVASWHCPYLEEARCTITTNLCQQRCGRFLYVCKISSWIASACLVKHLGNEIMACRSWETPSPGCTGASPAAQCLRASTQRSQHAAAGILQQLSLSSPCLQIDKPMGNSRPHPAPKSSQFDHIQLSNHPSLSLPTA